MSRNVNTWKCCLKPLESPRVFQCFSFGFCLEQTHSVVLFTSFLKIDKNSFQIRFRGDPYEASPYTVPARIPRCKIKYLQQTLQLVRWKVLGTKGDLGFGRFVRKRKSPDWSPEDVLFLLHFCMLAQMSLLFFGSTQIRVDIFCF